MDCFPFFQRPESIRMHLDRRAVQRQKCHVNPDHLFPLECSENPCDNTSLHPAADAYETVISGRIPSADLALYIHGPERTEVHSIRSGFDKSRSLVVQGTNVQFVQICLP